MTSRTRARRTHRGKPRAGSSRWFRPYRALVVLGWAVVLAALLWVLFVTPARGPAMPKVAKQAVPVEQAAPASLPTKPVAKTVPVVAAQAPNLPADDAPHESATEWWYYSGHLHTESGEQYSFHVAAFLRQGALSTTAFHGSLLDHQSGKHYTDQSRTEGKPVDGRRDGFGFSFGPWQLAGSGPKHIVKMAGTGYALDLALTDSFPPVLHQAPGTPVPGLLNFGSAGTSYYTSRPRMKAEGSLVIDGVSKVVRGEVWFDHQWGDFEASKLRWNWFALQLADGADLMIYELFDRQGAPVLRMGTYAKDAAVIPLGAADFKATSNGTWKSRSTKVVFPMDWTISVPGKGIDLKLDPVIRHSLFNAQITTLNVYWEGAVTLSGSQGGVGFMELNGYEPVAGSDDAPGKKKR